MTLEKLLAHPVFKSLYPDKPFLRAHRLSPQLNPFEEQGIAVAALTVCGGIPHIKFIPTIGMMVEDAAAGRYEGKHTIVVDSSGNTAHAVARLAPAFGFNSVKVVMPSDVPNGKADVLRAFGDYVDIIYAESPNKTACAAGLQKDHHHLNQYRHLGNLEAHRRFTGPEILRALGNSLGPISAIALSLGSGGTAGGVGKHFSLARMNTQVVGVRPSLGECVPGARDAKRMMELVTLPWGDYVSTIVEVSRADSYLGTRQLWAGLGPQPGPTSGLAYKGLVAHLNGLSTEELRQIKGTCAAFLCPDDGRFYSSELATARYAV